MFFNVGDPVEIFWQDASRTGFWWPGVILRVLQSRYKVTFDNYDNSWDMVVRKHLVRRRREAEPSSSTSAPDGVPDTDSSEDENDDNNSEGASTDFFCLIQLTAVQKNPLAVTAKMTYRLQIWLRIPQY